MREMINEDILFKIAREEIIKVFGWQYLIDNNKGACTARGMVSDDTYMLFTGIKDSKDLPDRKANDKGWVVYALVYVDAYTGEIKKFEYELE